MPLVIAVGLAAAVSIGAAVALTVGSSREVASDDASPTSPDSVAATASASPTPDASVAQPPSPEPTPVAVPVIPNAAIAAITVDALAMWSEPNDRSNEFGELGAGARLFIIGEPTDSNGERWYRVAFVDGPRVSGFDVGPCQLNCMPTLGFIAVPVSGAEAPIAEMTIECPASPMTADQLAALLTLERLHCYGRSEITVTGVVGEPAYGPSGAFTPDWLADTAPRWIGSEAVYVHFAPSFEGDLPSASTVVEMIGHFEDPAAPTCEVDHSRVADGPPTAWVVLGCRAAFVVTDVEVLGAP